MQARDEVIFLLIFDNLLEFKTESGVIRGQSYTQLLREQMICDKLVDNFSSIRINNIAYDDAEGSVDYSWIRCRIEDRRGGLEALKED